MSPTISNVFLEHVQSGQLVPAELYDCILPKHLDDRERLWGPLLASSRATHSHWDWRGKVNLCARQLSLQAFAVECGGETQGLMLVDTTKRARIPSQANKHLVYVELVESAPWNREPERRYKGVGIVLMAAAIQLSKDEGNGGRIGLHSLLQVEDFYRSVCGMTDLGPDVSYDPEPLRYFEMTEAQAEEYLSV